MTERWLSSGNFEHADTRHAFDPVLEGRKLGLGTSVSLEIWSRVCMLSRGPDGQPDEHQAQKRFHETAKRVAARGGQLAPEVGKRTLVEVETRAGVPTSDVFDDPVPGKLTEVEVRASDSDLAQPGQSTVTPASRTSSPMLLDPQLGSRMSRLFGVDLSGVKLVPDSPVATGTTRALTRHGEVHLRKGEYRPGTPHADWLIAHELAHVVQQRGGGDHPTASRKDLEREADRAATQVAHGRAAPIALRAPAFMYYAFDENDSHELDVPALDGARHPSGGEPLPRRLRELLERHLGVGLVNVRLHRDAAAAKAASSAAARAFTVGEHVFFASGQPDVDTREGFELLTHELAHVRQFYDGRIPGGMRVSTPDDALEREAKTIGRDVASAAAPTWFARAAPTEASESAAPRPPNPAAGVPVSQQDARAPVAHATTASALPVLREADPGTAAQQPPKRKPLRPNAPVKPTTHDIEQRVQAILQAFKARVEATVKDDLGDRPGLLERLAVQSEWDKVIAASDIASVLLQKDYKMSRLFLYHYLTANGAPLVYTPPLPVCEEISKRRPRPGHYTNIDSYRWGNADIRNGLGHFNLDVVDAGVGKKLYFIADRYRFPERDDKGKEVRHGFQIGKLSKERADALNAKLAKLGVYKRAGGGAKFGNEKFVVEKSEENGDYTLYVPQRLLADHGVDYESMGVFEIAPDESSAAK